MKRILLALALAAGMGTLAFADQPQTVTRVGAPPALNAMAVQGADGGFPVTVTCTNCSGGSGGGSGGTVSGTIGVADGGVIGIAPGAIIGIADGGTVGLNPGTTIGLTGTPNPECTSFIAINQTSGTTVITGTASQHIYICSIVLVSATAQNVSVIEGTGTVCASGTPIGVIGGTTASIAVAANGGFAMSDGRPWFKSRSTGDNLCIVQGGAGNVSGGIFYVSAP